MVCRHPWTFLAVIAWLAVIQPELAAQNCLTEMGDVSAALSQLAQAKEPATVFEIAARYGELVVPGLRKISRPNRPIETLEGAAQAALAKLGDERAFNELSTELEGTEVREKRPAIWKLGFAATPEGESLLISFLVGDNCKHCFSVGDTGYDPRVFVHEMLTMVLPDPPIERRTFSDLDLPVWQKWWKSHKGHLTTEAPHLKLSNPNLRCLATRAEWHRVEAVALMAEEGGTSVVPVLQDLVRLGYKDELGNFDTVRGTARTALAMLGDQGEFEAIVHELQSWNYVDALLKLRYISNKNAVDAITANINEIAYLTRQGTPYNYEGQVARHRNEFLTVLAQMVRDSPLKEKESYSDNDIQLWRAWWATNRDHARVVPRS